MMMPCRKLRSFCSVLLVVVLTLTLGGCFRSTNRSLAVLSGRVLDLDGNPVGGNDIVVSLDGKGKTVNPDTETGRFTFTGLPLGRYKLVVTASGDRGAVAVVEVNAESVTASDITLLTVGLANGWNSFTSGNWEEARAAFNGVINAPEMDNASKRVAYTGLGWISARIDGDYNDAIECFNHVTAGNSLLDAKIGLAASYYAAGQMSDALTAINAVLGQQANYKSDLLGIMNVDLKALRAAINYALNGPESATQDIAEVQNSAGNGSLSKEMVDLLSTF